MQWLKRILGGKPRSPDDDPDALIYYVRGHKCGAITRVRIHKHNELSLDDDGTLFVRKVVVDNRCYGRVEIVLRFDGAYHELSREITGGEFVTREAWLAQQASAQTNR